MKRKRVLEIGSVVKAHTQTHVWPSIERVLFTVLGMKRAFKKEAAESVKKGGENTIFIYYTRTKTHARFICRFVPLTGNTHTSIVFSHWFEIDQTLPTNKNTNTRLLPSKSQKVSSHKYFILVDYSPLIPPLHIQPLALSHSRFRSIWHRMWKANIQAIISSPCHKAVKEIFDYRRRWRRWAATQIPSNFSRAEKKRRRR